MTTILKKLDYNQLAEKIVELESAPVIKEQKRIQYSYCYIYTDVELNFRQLGDLVEKKSQELIKNTGKDYVTNKKRPLSVSTNLLTRIYPDTTYINQTIYPDNLYNSQFRSISNYGEFVPSVPFSVLVLGIKQYFIGNISEAENIIILDTNNIVNGNKIENLAPYSDIINTKKWLYNTKYQFDFQVDRDQTMGNIMRNYQMPYRLYNDIYVLDQENKATNCKNCKSLLFGKYYVIQDETVCRFCIHFPNFKPVSDDEIIFVDDNKLQPSDIGFSEIMNLRDFQDINGYYSNDDYILFPKEAVDYVFDKNRINPAINGKTKKVILISLIKY